jgi:hypothetical protein
MMTEEEDSSCRPGIKNSNPIHFSEKLAFQKSLVSLNQCISTSKILRIIKVLIAFLHRGKQLLEIDELIQDDFPPNQLR